LSDYVEFEEDTALSSRDAEDFRLDLEGYEGPIDALLQLARDQKVDLTNISILELAEQYLEFVGRARRLNLELAADYLVMAAWLAYLKSRLLLPDINDDDEPSGAEMAAALKFQMQRLQAMQDAGGNLKSLPQLGSAFFARGEPQPLKVVRQAGFEASLHDLLAAYARNKTRAEVSRLHIAQLDLYSVEDALKRLSNLMGGAPGWRSLSSFLPPELRGGLLRRSAIASTFAASLEMAREGKLRIRQDGTYGPIYLRGTGEEFPRTS
jgi:segregation and condensation protein A